jgi:hypothetical protein
MDAIIAPAKAATKHCVHGRGGGQGTASIDEGVKHCHSADCGNPDEATSATLAKSGCPHASV